jgi:phospholipid transport system substrate-binding protein
MTQHRRSFRMLTRTWLTIPVLPLVLFASSASASALADSPPSPKPWLKTVVDKAHALARKKVQVGSPDEAKWRAEAKEIIDDTLDWSEMTEQALGRNWKSISPAEQKEFATLLREMIESSYQAKLKLVARGEVKKPEQVKIEWLDEKVEGNEATAAARVKTEKNVAVVEFKLKWKGGRWRVWDVAIDDVSTVRTYRTQFTKIISKDGFPALIARMRSKIDDIRAGRSDIGP